MVLFADLYSSNMTISAFKIHTNSCFSCVYVSLRHMYVCMYMGLHVCGHTYVYLYIYALRGLRMKANIIVLLIVLCLRY